MPMLLADVSPAIILFHPVGWIAGLFVTVAMVLTGRYCYRRMKSKDRNPEVKP